MKITLMNKNTPLMSLDIDIKTSYVKEILDGNKNLPGKRSEKIAQSIHERIHMLEKVRDQQRTALTR